MYSWAEAGRALKDIKGNDRCSHHRFLALPPVFASTVAQAPNNTVSKNDMFSHIDHLDHDSYSDIRGIQML